MFDKRNDSSVWSKSPIVSIIGTLLLTLATAGMLIFSSAAVRAFWEALKYGWSWGGLF